VGPSAKIRALLQQFGRVIKGGCMKRVSFAKGILFVLGLGSLIPGAGCLWSGDDESEGRICASPIEGGTYCVDSSSGPSAAWNEAMANGSEPIAMWVIWPIRDQVPRSIKCAG
jgi:hypothetical protein